MRMRYVTLLGKKFTVQWYVPSDPGTRQEVELTEAEYRALGVKGAGEPHGRTSLAQVWVAFEWLHYDTPDGKRHPGDVTEVDGEVRLVLPSGKRHTIRTWSGTPSQPDTLQTDDAHCVISGGELTEKLAVRDA